MTTTDAPLIDLRLHLWQLKAVGLLGLEGAEPWVTTLHGLYSALGVAAFVLTVAPALAALARDWGDLNVVVDSTCITLPATFSSSRCVYFICRRRRMARLIAALLRFENYDCPRAVAAERASIMTKVSRDLHATTIFFNIMAALLFLTIAAAPIVTSTGEKRLLPVTTAYFFDHQKSPLYEVVYVLQASTVMLIIFSVITFDTVCMALLMHASAQYKVLAMTLRNMRQVVNDVSELGGNPAASRKAATINRSDAIDVSHRMRQCLIHCIKHHEAINKLVVEIDNAYHPVMLVLILFSMTAIAINSFMVSESSAGVGDLMKFAAVALSGTVELYFYCYLCDDIIQQSQRVADAASSCDWCDADVEVKRIVQMIITRANTPVTVTAGRFKLMSLETFAAIMNSSYSFFAMLKQLNK